MKAFKPVQVNPVEHFATVDLTEMFIGELSMHRVPRSFFDLIPGKAKETTGVNGTGTYWTKSLHMSSGRSHVPLTVFCDEPPITESSPARSVADEATNSLREGDGESAVERTG